MLQNLEREALAFCVEFMRKPQAGRRIVIWGSNGSGKTHCCRSIHRWACQVAIPWIGQQRILEVEKSREEALARNEEPCWTRSVPLTASFLFWPSVVDGFKKGQWDVVDDAVEDALLVLDDIGAEHDPSGVGIEKLCYILERRLHRWTAITTNISPDNWEAKFERRVASRLLRNSTVIGLEGVPDFSTL